MKVFFYNTPSNKNELWPPPILSKKIIPEWYKKIPNSSQIKTSSVFNGFNMNLTLKECSPFLDCFTSGYTFTLPCDVVFDTYFYENNFNIRYSYKQSEFKVVSNHSIGQMPTFESGIIDKKFFFPLKWENPWIVKTPKGYSTLFTHPINRDDLPFKTFSGIVETDKWNLPVNFPFYFLKNEEGRTIIKEGTPICQIIFFKRENWKSFIKKQNELEYKKNLFNLYMEFIFHRCMII